MATYFARKAGNINAADVWATTPAGTAAAVTFASGDVLVANSFTVTVNVSVDLGSTGQVRNDTSGGATNGGGFILKANQTLTATVITGAIASCLTFADAGSTYVVGTINANATNVSTSGLVNNSPTGTVFVTGNVVGSSAGANATGITNSAGGIINLTGSVLGGSGTAMRNSAGGTIIVTGPVEAGLGISGFGHGILNAAAGTIQVVGNVTASSNLPAISSTNASSVVRVSGSFIYAVNGQVPIASNRVLLNTTPTLAFTRYAVNGTGTYFDMFTADNTGLGPATGNVRAGVSYGGGLVGSCAVPAAGSVALGVPVDAGYGTAVLTPEAVWGAATRTLTSASGPTAADNATAVWAAASRTITGGTVDTLTNAPSVPSAAAIASQVRTELSVELGRVDQNISTRLAAADYTAPSAAPSVTAIRQEMDANSTKLANLDASVSTRLAATDYTAPSAAPSVTAIRQEIDSNSTKLANLDATVSSRLATSGYTAPTSAPSVADIRTELAVELGRIDATVSSRLASASYTAPTTPPTAAEIATAVEGSLLNEADGQAVLNAIVGAIGNTNLSEVSLVAAVRADLERNGGKLDSIPTTSAPSASTVAGAVRTELGIELGRIDAAVSTRLASADYTAPTAAPTAAQNASAVRSELSTELSRVDAAVSTRLASSAYTAPANSDIAAVKAKTDNLPASPAATGDIPSANITAIKAKTDLLNTDRLANVATTNIVGTLLAQANS